MAMFVIIIENTSITNAGPFYFHMTILLPYNGRIEKTLILRKELT